MTKTRQKPIGVEMLISQKRTGITFFCDTGLTIMVTF